MTEIDEEDIVEIERERKRRKAWRRVGHYSRTIRDFGFSKELEENLKKELAGILERANFSATILLDNDESLSKDERKKIESIEKNLQELENDYLELGNSDEIYLQRAKRAQHNENYEEEIECYNKVLELDPENIKALFRKGLALADLDRYEEMIECFDDLIEVDPEFGLAYENKAEALAEMGKDEEAKKAHEKFIEIEIET